ncbi:AraC-like DNA-binding protein [Pedobacter cryoconitis]|uniref:helix-turn-helix domain-containing protein n=1 Tax=Pedobacter cryoconitis TaxID=188932 RepID=UPI00161752C5|nr:AraC family transcriptional regulator [Pedobacter cryoconitis]MBB6274268.1 AraC-like DNA-binding protein [Pedobacter cryoconitis]
MTDLAVITIDLETSLSDSFSTGYLSVLPFELNQSYRISFNQFLFFKKGKGRVGVDGAAYTVCPGTLILLAKNQVYTFKTNHGLEAYSLCFGDCFWEKTPASANNCKAALFNDATANQYLKLQKEDVPEINRLFQEILTEFESADYSNKGDVLAAFLKILIIKVANLHALLAKITDQNDHKIYQRFIDLLAEHYQVSHDVTFFAEKLNISSRKLTELCRKHAGKGAKDIIQLQLVAEAKRFLQFSSSSIKEIAAMLNFSNPYQFSHFFKKNTSFPPEKYRKQVTGFGI